MSKNIQCDVPGTYYLTATRHDKITKFRTACCKEIYLTKMVPLANKLVEKGWRVTLSYDNQSFDRY